jgi:type I restriction enzyme, S subunit
MNKLPSGWKLKTLGEIAEVVGGGTPSTRDTANFGGSIPWLTPADLSGYTSKYISHGERSISEQGLKSSSAKMMPAGTVLFTSRAPIGYVAIASTSLCTNQGFKSFVLKEGVLPDYVYWWLKGNKELAESFASGTTFLELSGTKAKHLPIPIPPTTEEQEQIVAEIEKQFSRLDEAVTALKRIQANLKRYKAAVLKAAVEGKLTEQWRKDHPDIEPAEQLLKRIIAERRAKWEAEELAKMMAKGIKPKDDSWKKKYKEPTGPDTANLPELPEGWVWASVAQLGTTGEQAVLTGPFGSNIGKADFCETGVPVLSIGCLREDGLSRDKVVHVSEKKAEELSRYKLKQDDMLFSRMATVGRAGFVTQQFEGALFNYHLMRLRLDKKVTLPMYFVYYVRGASAVRDYVREVNHGATRDGINTEQLLLLPVALPPSNEQQKVLEEIDRRLSVTEEVESTIEVNLKRAERLRQAILKNFFCCK